MRTFSVGSLWAQKLAKAGIGQRVKGHPDRILIGGEQAWIPPVHDNDDRPLKYDENGELLDPDDDEINSTQE